MPSVSPKQARLMAAVAHGWKKPGGGGPSVAVAKEFNAADEGMSLADRVSGGLGKRKISGALAGVIHRAKMAQGRG